MKQLKVKAVPSVSYGRVIPLAKPICANGKRLLHNLCNDKSFMKVEKDIHGNKTYVPLDRVTFSPEMVQFLRSYGVELIIDDLSDFVLPKVGQAIDRIKIQESPAIDLSFL